MFFLVVNFVFLFVILNIKYFADLSTEDTDMHNLLVTEMLRLS
jgi:hypothetical protein